MTKSILSVVIGVLIGWLVRHYFKTPGFRSDTTRFVRQSGSRMRLYSPPTLRLTLYLSLACVDFSDDTVKDWQLQEEQGKIVTERQYQRFRLGNAKAALIAAVAFLDQSLSKANKQREDVEKLPLG